MDGQRTDGRAQIHAAIAVTERLRAITMEAGFLWSIGRLGAILTDCRPGCPSGASLETVRLRRGIAVFGAAGLVSVVEGEGARCFLFARAPGARAGHSSGISVRPRRRCPWRTCRCCWRDSAQGKNCASFSGFSKWRTPTYHLVAHQLPEKSHARKKLLHVRPPRIIVQFPESVRTPALNSLT